MRAKENNTGKLVKVPENGLLSLVADKLKGKVVFPEKVEKIRHDLKNVQHIKH